MLSYWFYPNPGNTHYSDPKVLILFAACGVLILFSFVLGFIRKKVTNPVTKKLTRQWPRFLRWMGLIGVALVVARVEDIQFFAMRALWGLWVLVFVLFTLFQAWHFRKKHYTVVKKVKVVDARNEYLPGGN
jgi:hypothetical protein